MNEPIKDSDKNPFNDPILVIRNLSCACTSRPWGVFGKKEVKPVLDNVNLEIGRGEIFGLAGESGCGKTTLGKCILGLTEYEGEIIINGRKRPGKHSSLFFGKAGSCSERRKSAFDVQAVFQDAGASLNPAHNIGWILEEPLRVHKLLSAAERQYKVDRVLDLVGLDKAYKKRKPRELSSGQKQRVSIGFSLMLEPSLLIADEPVSSLDVSVGAQIINIFRELNERLGLALLFISHNLELVYYLSSRVGVMRNGKICNEQGI